MKPTNPSSTEAEYKKDEDSSAPGDLTKGGEQKDIKDDDSIKPLKELAPNYSGPDSGGTEHVVEQHIQSTQGKSADEEFQDQNESKNSEIEKVSPPNYDEAEKTKNQHNLSDGRELQDQGELKSPRSEEDLPPSYHEAVEMKGQHSLSDEEKRESALSDLVEFAADKEDEQDSLLEPTNSSFIQRFLQETLPSQEVLLSLYDSIIKKEPGTNQEYRDKLKNSLAGYQPPPIQALEDLVGLYKRTGAKEQKKSRNVTVIKIEEYINSQKQKNELLSESTELKRIQAQQELEIESLKRSVKEREIAIQELQRKDAKGQSSEIDRLKKTIANKDDETKALLDSQKKGYEADLEELRQKRKEIEDNYQTLTTKYYNILQNKTEQQRNSQKNFSRATIGIPSITAGSAAILTGTSAGAIGGATGTIIGASLFAPLAVPVAIAAYAYGQRKNYLSEQKKLFDLEDRIVANLSTDDRTKFAQSIAEDIKEKKKDHNGTGKTAALVITGIFTTIIATAATVALGGTTAVAAFVAVTCGSISATPLISYSRENAEINDLKEFRNNIAEKGKTKDAKEAKASQEKTRDNTKETKTEEKTEESLTKQTLKKTSEEKAATLQP